VFALEPFRAEPLTLGSSEQEPTETWWNLLKAAESWTGYIFGQDSDKRWTNQSRFLRHSWTRTSAALLKHWSNETSRALRFKLASTWRTRRTANSGT